MKKWPASRSPLDCGQIVLLHQSCVIAAHGEGWSKRKDSHLRSP
ncbi:MAG TPA: hypothetical protein VG936_06135 [Lacunisphaera sp.]|nr:hypothetical protein [Lacunisphaera sp.]